MKKIGAAVLAASVLAGAAAGGAWASPPPVVPITLYPSDAQGNKIPHPGYWIITAAAGTKTTLYAVVGDPSHQATVVKIVPIDAANAIDGGLSYKLPTAARKGVGAWVRLPTSSIHLDPKKGDVISFTVAVPKKAKPGQYVGGVSAYVPNTKEQKSGNVAITVQPRVVTAVEVNVPGPKHSQFKLADVEPRTLAGNVTYVQAHIKNVGNTLLSGTGYLWLYRQGQRKPALYQVLHIGTSLPHSTVTYQALWAKKPARGTYKWVLKVTWGSNHSTSGSGTFSVK